MSTKDPIVQDVRSTREKLFDEHGGDLDKLLDHYQDQEKLDQDRLVTNTNKEHNNKTTPGAA